MRHNLYAESTKDTCSLCERLRTPYRSAKSIFLLDRLQEQVILRTVIEAWQNGVLPPRPFFSRVLRRYLLQSCSERCQRCGWSERNPYSGNSTLELEHIDGDWTNSHPSNLILLCPNCHSLTPTFRGLNRGRGRPGRPGHRDPGKPPLPPPPIPIATARPADPSLFDLSPEAAGAT